jgi:hypothetical protein
VSRRPAAPSWLTAVALVLLVAPPVLADQTSVEWEAPPRCPGKVDVERAIARLREGKPPPVRSVRARGVVTQAPGARPSLQLSLSTADAETTRVLDGDSCAELVDAAALLVVLATDAEDDGPPAALPAEPPRREPQPPPPPPPRPTSPDDEKDPSTGAPAEPPPFDFGVRFFAAIDAAALPKPAPGFGAGGSLQGGPWRGELLGAYFPDQTGFVVGGGPGAEISLLLVVARFCGVPLRKRFEVAGCVGGEAGVVRAVGFGVDEPGSGSATWLAPQIAAVGHLHITPILSGFTTVELAVPLARERFVLVNVGDVHGPPDITVRGALGIEVGP